MSPGVSPRPSLNAYGLQLIRACQYMVSPGVSPRPSLNDGRGFDVGDRQVVSPGVSPRPSLNALILSIPVAKHDSVAGG